MTGAGESGPEADVDIERLEYARIEGPGPVLAYMADNKSHVSSRIFFEHVIDTTMLLRKSHKKHSYAH